MESHIYKIVPLKNIFPKFPYLTRMSPAAPALKASIAKRGILQPLILAEAGGEYRVVAGHCRYQAAFELGLKQVPAVVLGREARDGELFLMAVLSNWGQQRSELDNAFAISRALELKIERSEILEEILPALGLPPEAHKITEAKEIMLLAPALLEAAAKGTLPVRGLRALAFFSAADQKVFAEKIAAQVPLTSNQMIKLAEWLNDLAAKTGLEGLLSMEPLSTILGKNEKDARQKSEKFFEAVKTLRFPQWSKKEKEFQALKKSVDEGAGGLSVEAPAFFEGEGIVIRAQLKDREALERIVRSLEKKRKLLDGFFDLVL